tara:strand:+ start:73 stop:345 length:273 start_codon:yes stop_codon:yes gene_type:complete
MNKIFIALVLVVGLSGNAYANFITDYFKSEREMCLEAVEKGKMINELKLKGTSRLDNITYLYKGKIYQHWYNQNECLLSQHNENWDNKLR